MKFDLEKAKEKVKFTLEKKQVANVRAQISVCLDVSGSAEGLFTSGAIQEAFQRILPVGLNFDLNQQIDVYTFSSGTKIAHITPNADAINYVDYVRKNILENRSVPKWGGTDYAPVLEQNLKDFGFYKKGLFGGSKLVDKSQSGEPVVIYFLTDGVSYDEPKTVQLLKDCAAAKTQVYFNFIGIGDERNFKFIEKLGIDFPNVGYWNLSDLSAFTQDDIYDNLIPQELVDWLK